jgi:hypothetical protein
MPKPLPSIVKTQKHVSLNAGYLGLIRTGVYLNEGEIYSIFATGSIDHCPTRGTCNERDVRPEMGWSLLTRIGKKNFVFRALSICSNSATNTAMYSGELFIGYKNGKWSKYREPLNPENYKDDIGAFSIEVIVWEKADWIQISDFLDTMKQKDPENKPIIDALKEVNALKKIYLAEAKASKAIEETKKSSLYHPPLVH